MMYELKNIFHRHSGVRLHHLCPSRRPGSPGPWSAIACGLAILEKGRIAAHPKLRPCIITRMITYKTQEACQTKPFHKPLQQTTSIVVNARATLVAGMQKPATEAATRGGATENKITIAVPKTSQLRWGASI